MKKKINDRKYTLIVPKYDNEGHKIKSEEIEEIAKKMSERFGGITVFPSILGCWKPKERPGVKCEENTIISSVRNSEDVENWEKVKKQDEEFMKNLAKKYGVKFGQESVMSSTDRVEVSFIPGKYTKEIKEKLRGVDWFKKLI